MMQFAPILISLMFILLSFYYLYLFLRKFGSGISKIITFGLLGVSLIALYVAFRSSGVTAGVENMVVNVFLLAGSFFVLYSAYYLWAVSGIEVRKAAGKAKKKR